MPAPSCAFCERAVADIGGRRITWSTVAGVTVRAPRDQLSHIPSHALLAPLPLPHSGMIVAWPPDDRALNVAVAQWISRTRPWTCQVCASHVCDRCGSPTRNPWGCDVLSDDGRVLHVPLLPGPAGCTRHGCAG